MRQHNDLALGCKHVHLVGEQVDLDVFQELDGVVAFGLHVQQALQPLVRALLGGVDAGVAGFVHPVRGNAGLGHRVHFAGADLHFHRRAVGAEQGGVQALVAVAFGNGDVVLELARNGLVQAVQCTQRQVAAGVVFHDDAKAVDVQHFGKRQAFFLHFLVDAVQVFLAALDGGLDIGFHQLLADGFQDLVHHFAPVAACGTHGFGQHVVAVRVQVHERQVLQLAVHLVQADAVGDGCVDFQRFQRYALTLVFAHGVQRAHIVQAVGQLDDDDADVACHRQYHLAEVFRLRGFLGLVLQLFQLGQPVYQVGNGAAKLVGQRGLGDAGVFQHVVHQRGGQPLCIQPPVGEHGGYR